MAHKSKHYIKAATGKRGAYYIYFIYKKSNW